MGVVLITTPINIYMKQFRATVKASGLVVTTVVFAENTNSAMKILQAQFGAKNVIGKKSIEHSSRLAKQSIPKAQRLILRRSNPVYAMTTHVKPFKAIILGVYRTLNQTAGLPNV